MITRIVLKIYLYININLLNCSFIFIKLAFFSNYIIFIDLYKIHIIKLLIMLKFIIYIFLFDNILKLLFL